MRPVSLPIPNLGLHSHPLFVTDYNWNYAADMLFHTRRRKVNIFMHEAIGVYYNMSETPPYSHKVPPALIFD
jgi:hypothetical protein